MAFFKSNRTTRINRYEATSAFDMGSGWRLDPSFFGQGEPQAPPVLSITRVPGSRSVEVMLAPAGKPSFRAHVPSMTDAYHLLATLAS